MDNTKNTPNEEQASRLQQLAVTRRVLLRVGMRVVVKASGLEANVDTIYPYKYVVYKFDAEHDKYGWGGATVAAGLLALDGSPVFHPNGG